MATFTLLHILALAYWLGTDMSSFYLARFIQRKNLSIDTVLALLKIQKRMGIFSEAMPPLILLSGFGMAMSIGLISKSISLIVVGILVILGWIVIIFWHKASTRSDFMMRLSVAVVILGWVCYSLYHRSRVEASLSFDLDAPLEKLVPVIEPLGTWLCLKLVIFTIAMGCGLLIRWILLPLDAQVALLQNNDDRGMRGVEKNLRRCYPLIFIIWGCLLINTILGLQVVLLW